MRFLFKILTSILLTLTLTTTNAQWNTVGNGLASGDWGQPSYIYSGSKNGNVFVFYSYPYKSNSGFNNRLAVWNGSNWFNYSIGLDSSHFIVNDVTFSSNNKIYICGEKYGNDTIVALYEYINQNHINKLTPPDFEGQTKLSVDFNGAIYIAGQFRADSINGTYRHVNIMRYNNNQFDSVAPLDSLFNITDMIVYNNNLYVTGYKLVQNDTNFIYKYNLQSNTWTPSGYKSSSISGGISHCKFVEYNSELYLTSTIAWQIYKVDNDTIKLFGNLQHGVTSHTVVGNYLYLVGGDTTVSITQYDGVNFNTIYGTTSVAIPNASSITNLNGELYVFSKTDTVMNGITYNRAFRRVPNFSNIAGTVYEDLNSNGFMDTNEGIPGVVVSLGSINITHNIQSTTDQSGFFSISVPPGTYGFDTIYPTLSAYSNYILDTNNNLPSSFPVIQSQTYSINIPMINNAPINMKTSISNNGGFIAEYNSVQNYVVEARNTGTDTLLSTNLTVEVPSSLNINNINPSPISQNGNTLVFSMSNFLPGEVRNISINTTINSNYGDTLTFTSEFDPILGDVNPNDNVDTLRQVVDDVKSIGKQCSVSYIKENSNNKTINYQINFRNITSDTITDLMVVDTLQYGLSGFFLNGVSHPFEFSYTDGALIWKFNNINLPDSASNPEKSRGFVNFTAILDTNLSVGDTIYNTAQVYLDYNLIVSTETTKTAYVAYNISIEEYNDVNYLNIYPNPTSGLINIDNNTNQTEFYLLDVSGKVVLKDKLENGRNLFNISYLPSGMYILTIGSESHKIVVW